MTDTTTVKTAATDFFATDTTDKTVSSVNLAVNLGGREMKCPITVASGTFGSGRDFAELWQQSGIQSPSDQQPAQPLQSAQPAQPAQIPQPSQSSQPSKLSRLGAVTTKGVSLKPWPGNPTPRITQTASGMLNSIGLQNAGVEAFCESDLAWLASQDVPVIVNVCGHSIHEYLGVIQRLESEATVSAYEVNISCPNVDCGGMAFGTNPELAAQVTAICRAATKRPLIVKLSPNVTDITQIARAVEAAGADALSLINTVTGMAIDIRKRKPVLPRGVGGLSGPAIKPIALQLVHQTSQAVQIPLLGMGGITTVEDIVEFLLAGASAVAIGTANFIDPLIVPRLISELNTWCQDQQVTDIHQLIGALE
jgi:dihydroorotate dehydrogenase (NAD+) catalytic subunit